MRYRQEVLNVVLAQLLQERGVASVPEQIIKSIHSARKMPDVLITFSGLRVIIEGEVADQPDAEKKALESAQSRVDNGVSHIAIAVVYPKKIRNASFSELKDRLSKVNLKIALVTESGTVGYSSGTVNQLESALRHTYDQLIKEDVVQQAVELLDQAMEHFAKAIAPNEGSITRLAEALGIREADEKQSFSEAQKLSVGNISSLVLLNALISQETITEVNSTVLPLQSILSKDRVMNDLSDHWKFIYEKIDYYPIFYVAREIINCLPASTDSPLKELIIKAQKIISLRAALRHDLMGRVYHRLLAEAKFLGTYYTSIPAATLLLKLALNTKSSSTKWQELNEIKKLRIADPACGTGTLLMAAADAVTDNYISTSAAMGLSVDNNGLQKILTEEVLFGYDVLPSAVHLTASTLALRSPGVPYTQMNLFSLPFGGVDKKLGSLEYLKRNVTQVPIDLFGTLPQAEHITGQGVNELQLAPIPKLDLCVMNPPFTRSVGGNLLFGSLPDKERSVLQTELKNVVKTNNIPANITAGLGSVFVALADKYIKPSGKIALVLPKAILSGVSWGPTRELLINNYRIEYIVSSHEPGQWNFSESTSLSEVLIVASKIKDKQKSDENNVNYFNLWDNPNTDFEALTVAESLINTNLPDVYSENVLNVKIANHKIGEAFSIPQNNLSDSWIIGASFAQHELIRVVSSLLDGNVYIPGTKKLFKVSMVKLNELGTLGPDARDVHDAFEVSKSTSIFKTLWGHKTAEIYTISQKPNAFLEPLTSPKPGRKIRDSKTLWALAGDVLIAERLRLNNTKLTAVKLTDKVLSNVWWEFSFIKEGFNEAHSKALVLWLNSTLGILTLLLHREETEGSWVKFKKPTLSEMPILDLKGLNDEQLGELEKCFSKIHAQEIGLLSDSIDAIRAEIDECFERVLKINGIATIRELMSHEPILSNKPIT